MKLVMGPTQHKNIPSELWDRFQELCHTWAQEASDQIDTAPEDENKQPRYKCARCLEKGMVRSYGRRTNTVGHCDCDYGKEVGQRTWRSGRKLGPAMKEPQDNPFQHAIDEDAF